MDVMTNSKQVWCPKPIGALKDKGGYTYRRLSFYRTVTDYLLEQYAYTPGAEGMDKRGSPEDMQF